jgi:exodeoxyribonuclease X
MKVRVVDFETSDMVGKGRPVELCEVGWTDFDEDWKISRPQAFLVNPGHKITPEAQGVHHISDEMVADAMSPAAARQLLMEGMEPGDFFAAHHAEFERALFPGDPFPWICTMVCAKHLFPGAPGFGNQTLRYHLGVDADFEWPALAMPPHRAGPDTYVSAHILSRLTFIANPRRLVELTTTPVLLEEVPFERYRGQPWSAMDRGFLEWVLAPGKQTPMKPEVLHTARHWLQKLDEPGNPFA